MEFCGAATRVIAVRKESKRQNGAKLSGEPRAAAKGDLGEECVRRDRAERQAVIGIGVLPVTVAKPECVNAHARQVKRAVSNVPAKNVTLVDRNLGAEVPRKSRARPNGNQRV